MDNIRLYKFKDSVPLIERFGILELNHEEEIESNVYKEGYYCFLLLNKGTAELIIEGEKAKIQAPALICGLPGDTWEWLKTDGLKGCFICFDAETLMAGLSDGFSLDPIPFLNPEKKYPFIPLSEKRHSRLQLLVDDLKECLLERPVYFDLIRALMWQFIFLAEKEFILNGKQGRSVGQQKQLMQFIELVNKNYHMRHDTQFYANEMNITPNYLNKITNSRLGISAFGYILNRIISEAKILLKLTNINVSELAYKLGYENPNYFIRIFKKTTGTTPIDYRKRGTL